MSNDTKTQEYQERYRFWSDKRISQLSFHNNVLLTIAVAIIGFFWQKLTRVRQNSFTCFDVQFIDWKVVLFLGGMLLMALSIAAGIFLSLSRLYDLRITANIVLTRRRLIEERPDEKVVDEDLTINSFLTSICSLFTLICKWDDYEIRREEIKGSDIKMLQKKFTDARQKSDDLGNSTWKLINWQTVCFFLSILLFFISELIFK